jgi:hypothetical protein
MILHVGHAAGTREHRMPPRAGLAPVVARERQRGIPE